MVARASFIRVDPRVLDGCRQSPRRLRQVIDGRLKADRCADLDDAWDAVHFLLSQRRRDGGIGDCGDAIGLALFGGRTLDVSPSRRVGCVDPEAVVRIDRELQKVTGGQLDRRYDAAEMDRHGVAPGDWRGRGEEAFEYLLDAFLQWRELYHRASEDDQGVICLLR